MNLTKIAMARIIATGKSRYENIDNSPQIKKLMKLKKTDLTRKYNLFLEAIDENRD